MDRTFKSSLCLAAFVMGLSGTAAILSQPAAGAKSERKTLTLEDRQEQLMSNINKAQQSNELTTKEAHGLRSALADVAHKKAKIKGKKIKLSADDELKLESDLNDISVKITKLKLDKRVHPAEASKNKPSTKDTSSSNDKTLKDKPATKDKSK